LLEPVAEEDALAFGAANPEMLPLPEEEERALFGLNPVLEPTTEEEGHRVLEPVPELILLPE
jgi:hypothetical protein